MNIEPRQHLPWPMMLTTLRLLLVPVFLYLLVLAAPPKASFVPRDLIRLDDYRQAALLIFAIMAVTDKLDGYLARRLNQITKLGIFLDPVADKILITFGLLLLVFPRFAPAGFNVPWPILWGVYQKDICVIIGAVVVRHKLGRVAINANFFGKVNTAFEVALVIGTLLVPEWLTLGSLFTAVFMKLLWHGTVLATAAAAIGYSIEGARQLRAGVTASASPDKTDPPPGMEAPDHQG